MKGVEGVGYYAWFGGYYQDPRTQISVGAVDVDRLHSMFPELKLKDEYAAAMRTTRNGALIGRDLAATRGWKIGDRIPLKSTIYLRKDGAQEWDFEIVGIYDFGDGKIPTNELWFNYSYFDEARTFGNGTVSMYFAKIADPSRSGPISESIDQLFANSTFETQTLNERDWLRGRIAADRRHQVLRERDRRGRAVHAAVLDRQYDDAVRPRTDPRARGAQDLRLQQRLDPGARALARR